MPRAEDLSSYEITVDENGVAKFKFVGEVDLDSREWEAMRKATFTKLRNRGIPDELIDLVEHFEEQTDVTLYLFRAEGSDVALRFGIKANKKSRSERLAEFKELLKYRPENTPLTAGDALAVCLRIHVRSLRYGELKRSGAPVRASGLLPRSVIGETALDLLDSCRNTNRAPGPHLVCLFRELLNLDVDHGLTTYDDVKTWMAFAIARNPKIATRALARKIGVEPSTVSRWRRSPEFKQAVEREAQSIASLKVEAEGENVENILSCKEELLAVTAFGNREPWGQARREDADRLS
jgi:hypothetical protein